MAPARINFVVQPNSGVPIYRQIVEQVRAMVIGGQLEAGTYLPSVRQVSADLQVNPMTVSKAYALLAEEGTVERVRGTGVRIASTESATLKEKKQMLDELSEQLTQRAQQLGLSLDQTLGMVRNKYKGK